VSIYSFIVINCILFQVHSARMGITSIHIRHYWHKYPPSWVKISAHCGIKSALCVILIHFLPYPYLISQKPPSSHIYPPFSIKSASSFINPPLFPPFIKQIRPVISTNPPFRFINPPSHFIRPFIFPPSNFISALQPPNPNSLY
jgi:hypothetical protein